MSILSEEKILPSMDQASLNSALDKLVIKVSWNFYHKYMIIVKSIWNLTLIINMLLKFQNNLYFVLKLCPSCCTLYTMACSITFDVLLDSAIRILGIFHPYIEVLGLASTFTRGNYVSECYFMIFSSFIFNMLACSTIYCRSIG